ncbi:hypothetical protein V8D89_000994 [Ganoderma adspersum]
MPGIEDYRFVVSLLEPEATPSGFGKHLITSALARGDCVVATARNIEKHRAVFPTHDDHLHRTVLDITDSKEIIIARRIGAAVAVWGCIDVVVNNAGYVVTALLEDGERVPKSPHWLHALVIAALNVLNVTNAVLPHMSEGCSGTVVILGSRSAWRLRNSPAGLYATVSKPAVHSIGEAYEYATELHPFNVRVLAVARPGLLPHRGSRGDRPRAMELVGGEGRAVGREWPVWLVFGKDADADVRAKCTDRWEDVARDLEFECEPLRGS